MNNPTKTKIEIARYPQHEMAFILVNNESVFTGNYHDFHSGCHGSVIAGYNLDGLWDRGIDSLGGALKLVMEKDGKDVELSKKNLTQAEYKSLGF